MENQKQPAHTYTVALRFYGENLDPNKITEKLNLRPSRSLSQAEIDTKKSERKRLPIWSFDGKGEIGFQDEWENLEQGLNFLLSLLHPNKANIIELSQEFTALWFIGHFQNSFDGGYTLSPKIMKELSEYEAILDVDNYFTWAEEE